MEERRDRGGHRPGQGHQPGRASTPASLTTPSPAISPKWAESLFFSADDRINGRELWKTDGTEAGTVLVKDINPGSSYSGFPYDSHPSSLTAVGGTLFFTADDGTTGQELWKSDGTAEGTVLVKDIRPGSSNYGYPYGSDAYELTAVGGTLYFTANDGVHGQELWQSDGTEAGTVLVMDIRPGGDGSSPDYLAFVNGALFFAANDGRNGLEPWILRWDEPAAPAGAADFVASRRARRSRGRQARDALFAEPTLEPNWLSELALDLVPQPLHVRWRFPLDEPRGTAVWS